MMPVRKSRTRPGSIAAGVCIGWLLVVRAASLWLFGLYEGLWRYTSVYDLRALVSGILAGSLAFTILNSGFLHNLPYPRSVLIIDTMLLVFMLGGLRLCRRILLDFPRKPSGKRVLSSFILP